MASKPIDQLGELQREVLELLWESGASTVQKVADQLSETGRVLAYTTVLTTLQNLEKTGWAKHRRKGRAYVYRAARSKSSAGAKSVRSFIQRAFGGDRLQLFQSLVDDNQLSEEDLQHLQQLIDAKRQEKSK